MLINKSILLFGLILKLEETEIRLPDDQWDEQHWKGFKAGLIESISIVLGMTLNYNLNSNDIRKILIERGAE